MTVTLLVLAVFASIAGWWLWQQGLASKPWLEEGPTGGLADSGGTSMPAAKVGLSVFLAVVGTLFALLVSAYFMRMDMADWQALPIPRLLWLNTGALVLCSAALVGAQVAARRRQIDEVKAGLLAAGVAAIIFLVGQLLVWRQLSDAGYLLTSNPANSFFYLITALHGVHVAGGLVALGWTTLRVHRGLRTDQVRLSVELCALYWHFLLIVWLALFVLLMRWVDDFILMCRQLLT